ncbi:MAG: NAD+ synthase [Gammaproteobacteria bacterium]|nr:NAD+ synthase [Gammaproteobacteria bacterium]
MSKKLRIVMAQLDLIVGDIPGNLKKHIEAANTARDTLKADIIVFPELSITGYPAEDLLLRPSFINAANDAVNTFKETVRDIHCLIGHPHANSKGLHNSCSLIYNGTILSRYAKQHLPNYGVFDEKRYFIPGDSASVVPIHGIPVGITICEDLWFAGPAQQAATQGARLILSPNASPFEINKQHRREDMLAKRAKANGIPIVYVNCVGGQDDLIFDGGSMVVDSNGTLCQHAGFFKETLFPVDLEVSAADTKVQQSPIVLPDENERIYQALVMGVRDYIQKNRFPGALIGLSGGIDSALTLAIAVDALGKDKVKAVMMPSRYTADISNEDAIAMVKHMGVQSETISIEPMFTAILSSLAPQFAETKVDITEENIQARCRGILLMALSNKFGSIVLTTGNRSELAVGYSTLYGDMAGGFCVLKDVPKTLVYELANYRNRIDPIIPQRIIDRPPTAELAFDQKDEDSLPPYAELDQILELYLNQEKSLDEIVASGFDQATVSRVIKMINRNEYKRRQSPLGIRINNTAFGRDRRYPVTSGFDK